MWLVHALGQKDKILLAGVPRMRYSYPITGGTLAVPQDRDSTWLISWFALWPCAAIMPQGYLIPGRICEAGPSKLYT